MWRWYFRCCKAVSLLSRLKLSNQSRPTKTAVEPIRIGMMVATAAVLTAQFVECLVSDSKGPWNPTADDPDWGFSRDFSYPHKASTFKLYPGRLSILSISLIWVELEVSKGHKCVMLKEVYEGSFVFVASMDALTNLSVRLITLIVRDWFLSFLVMTVDQRLKSL